MLTRKKKTLGEDVLRVQLVFAVVRPNPCVLKEYIVVQTCRVSNPGGRCPEVGACVRGELSALVEERPPRGEAERLQADGGGLPIAPSDAFGALLPE